MDELLELRSFIEQKRYEDALELISLLEEMSREDKANKIRSFASILLLNLIKQQAEGRTTRTWDFAIYNARYQIWHTNQRRTVGGTYLDETTLQTVIRQAYRPALKRAALEVCEGQYDEGELAQKVNRTELEASALQLILSYEDEDEDEDETEPM